MKKHAHIIHPNFLYIGASKSGSSWIFECLREHPQVFIPIAKDLQFFDIYYDKGPGWYFSFFKKAKGCKAIGELSHDYFLFTGTAQRIHQLLPDVKLLCCLREPVDKMISSYKYAKCVYLDENVSFESFIFDDEHISINSRFRVFNMGPQSAQYFRNLLPFYEIFPRENILILFFDELKNDPGNFIMKILDFLKVDSNFKPGKLHQKVLMAREVKNTKLAHLAYDTAGVLRKMGLANFVGSVKRQEWFNKLLYTSSPEDIIVSQSTIERVKQYFSQDHKKLSELIHKPLPVNWTAETTNDR